MQNAWVYVGTYTQDLTPAGEHSRGIYRFQLDTVTGQLEPAGCTEHADNPSFLTISHDNKRLYAVSELGGSAAVTAYAIGSGGALEKLGEQVYPGSAMCHLTLSPRDDFLIASNYLSGTVLSIALDESGAPGRCVSEMRHAGSGPNAQRQEAPHAHSANFTLDGMHVIAADLGADALYTYVFDRQSGRLSAPVQTKVMLGEGPRHLRFVGEELYLLTELGGNLLHLVPGRLPGLYALRQSFSTLPEAFTSENTAAELALSGDYRFLYASNRGADTICVAERTEQGMRAVGSFPCGGKTPRHFALSPEDRFLIVANQHSHEVVVLPRDAESGRVGRALCRVPVPNPSCVQWVTTDA